MNQTTLIYDEVFSNPVKFKKPFIRAKVAMSSDHKSVFASKQRKWITGIPARNDVQRLRAEADIILTGSGTINEDSPSMNVRAKKIIANKNFLSKIPIIIKLNLRYFILLSFNIFNMSKSFVAFIVILSMIVVLGSIVYDYVTTKND